MVHQQIKLSDRERCAPGFGVKLTELRSIITYDGEPFAVVYHKAKGLPRGFHDRTLAHLFDLLVYRRTALWDEQTTMGPHPANRPIAERRANHYAATEEAAREAGMESGSHLPPVCK